MNNGDKYNGEYQFDKANGQGIMSIQPNKYIGEWKNGKKVGNMS